MDAGTPPLFETYRPQPRVVTAGGVVQIFLFLPGKPIQQDRPRGRVQGIRKVAEGVWHGKPWVQFYDEKKFSDYREFAATTMRNQLLQTPVTELAGGGNFLLPFENVRALLTLRFNMHKPVSYPARIVHHTKKPDNDNLEKMIMDALVDARILSDDSCITDLASAKRYETPEHPEGVEVDLTVMPTEV